MSSIRALVIGPGGVAAGVIEQLNKNDRFSITWIAEKLDEEGFEKELEAQVDRCFNLEKSPSPLTLEELIDDHDPDIVFWCQRGETWHPEDSVASVNFAREMLGEVAIDSSVPMITVSLEQNTQRSMAPEDST